MNGDGRQDIVSGCYSGRGGKEMVAPVWVLYRNKAGDFAAAQALQRDGGEELLASDGAFLKQLTDRICTEPFAFDHDRDGDLDLIIGNFAGDFLLATNAGSKTAPSFKDKPVRMQTADGAPLRLQGGNHGAPFVVDWDGDGDLDILSGSGGGGVQIAVNDPADDGTHRFSQFKPLIEAPKRTAAGIVPQGTPVTIGRSWRICVTDFNADGKLDLLVGDSLRRMVAKEGLTVEEAQAKDKAWNEAFAKLRKEMTGFQQEMRDLLAAKPKPADREAGDQDGDGEERPEDEDPEEEAPEAQPDPLETWTAAHADLTKKIQENQAAYRAHYKQRTTYIDTVATGHVWLYLRK